MCSNRASGAIPSRISLMFSSTSWHNLRSVIAAFFLQRAAQAEQRPRHAFARRGLLDATGRRHLLEAQLAAVAQQQRVAIAGPYPLQQAARLLGARTREILLVCRGSST